MRKIVLLSIVWLLFCANSLSAKVIRVNNQEPTKADQFTFDNLQDAYNNAVSGDSLYIEGSDVSYGSLDIAKRLIFIGSGFFFLRMKDYLPITNLRSYEDLRLKTVQLDRLLQD